MGYSYFAGSADTIPPAVIAAVTPGAWAAFQTVLAGLVSSTSRSADALLAAVGREEGHSDREYDHDEKVCEAIANLLVPALDDLRTAFESATSGLELRLGYAGSDTLHGSDLNDETYWFIGNHQQPTLAYAAFEKTHGSAITKTWITGG